MLVTYICVCMLMLLSSSLYFPSSVVVVITHSMKLDPATGLSTTSSTLQYTATKEDVGAVFACLSTHELINQETDLEPFPVHCKCCHQVPWLKSSNTELWMMVYSKHCSFITADWPLQQRKLSIWESRCNCSIVLRHTHFVLWCCWISIKILVQ